MYVHGYRSNTRNKVKRQGMYETVQSNTERFSQKKEEQAGPKTRCQEDNRSGSSNFSEEIRSSVKFRDFS